MIHICMWEKYVVCLLNACPSRHMAPRCLEQTLESYWSSIIASFQPPQSPCSLVPNNWLCPDSIASLIVWPHFCLVTVSNAILHRSICWCSTKSNNPCSCSSVQTKHAQYTITATQKHLSITKADSGLLRGLEHIGHQRTSWSWRLHYLWNRIPFRQLALMLMVSRLQFWALKCTQIADPQTSGPDSFQPPTSMPTYFPCVSLSPILPVQSNMQIPGIEYT